MKTVGEALIAKMESRTLTLSSSSPSFNKREQRKKDVETTFKEIIPEGGEKKEKELICPTKSVDWNNKLMNKRKLKLEQ